MDIRITGLSMLIQRMDEVDIKCLCNKYLHIDYQGLEKSWVDNRLKLEHLSTVKKTGKAKTGVIIGTSSDINTSDSNVTLELKKPFFDAVAAADDTHGFELGKLLRFISRYKYSIKQLDIAYTDDDRCLTERDIQHWCTYSKDYCVGSLVKWKAPELVVRGGTLRRIKLESSDSKSNYGTINIGPKGRISLALKIRKKVKIWYILEDYGRYLSQREAFEARSRSLLASCINFVTARSKKNRVKARYERQGSWRAFLGHEVEAINWSSLLPVRSTTA